MCSEYKPLRSLIDSPWHENMDEKWRPEYMHDAAGLVSLRSRTLRQGE